MKFFSHTVAFAALSFLASALAAPSPGHPKGFVSMAFEVGGRTEYLSLEIGRSTECLSIASNGQITNLWASDRVVCRLKIGDCGSNSLSSPPLRGEVSFNGSGYLAEFAKHALSIECGPSFVNREAHTLRMNINVNRRSEDINMEVSKTGCISLPPDVSINSMSIGSDAVCNLAVDCQTKTPVGGALTGRVDMQHVQSIARDAGALTCGPRTD